MNICLSPPEKRAKRATGEVKWYDKRRTFGFVLVPDFEQDFLLHANTLQNFGYSSISKGVMVDFEYVQTENGYRITNICSIGSPDSFNVDEFDNDMDNISEYPIPVRVKWFDCAKGYGFAQIFGETEDVFISIRILKRFGLADLRVGEALSVRVAENNGKKCVFDICAWV